MRNRFFLILFSLAFSISGYGQIDKLIKNKIKNKISQPNVRNKVRDAFISELENAREDYDTTVFNYAIALSDKAGLFESAERYERHKNVLLEAIKRKDNDLTQDEKVKSWVDRSEMLYANGKYRMSYNLLRAAKTYYEAESKQNTNEYARTIANMSLVAHTVGRLTKADEMGVISLDLRKKILGENSKGYAASVNNYALIKKDLGQYNDAEKLLEQAIDLNKSAHGEKSLLYAITLNNKAILYQTLGRYQEAEKLLNNALGIGSEQLREKSMNYQRLMINMALLYQDMKRYDEAEKIYLDAIKIKKKRLGTSHPDYAHLLSNLASLYLEMGKYDKVEELLKESIAIYKAKFGEESTATASAMRNLAVFYRYTENYEQARPLLEKVMSINSKTLDKTHPKVTQTMEDLAVIYWKTGNIEKASESFQNALNISLDYIDHYFLPMSESEKSKYWAALRPRFEIFNAFAVDSHREKPELLEWMYNYQLATKALLLSANNKIKSQILQSGNKELIDRYAAWVDQKESLSYYYSYSKEELAEEKINIDSLENAANTSEKYLSENSAVFASGYSSKQVKFESIQSKLDQTEATVEIIQVKKYKNTFTAENLYAALILTKNSAPVLATIDNGNQLETRYYKYYNNAIRNKMRDDYSYQQFWEQIDEKLGDKKNIYLSVDGIYSQVNVNTFIKPNGKYVIEDRNIVLVSNTKDVIGMKEHKVSSSLQGEAFLVGFPEYGNAKVLSPLPGTKKEIQTIDTYMKQKKVKTKVVLGQDAKEEKVKALDNPSILHIATHGFFLQDVGSTNEKVFGVSIEHAKDNPLLRSGLMFTGASNTVEGMNTSELTGVGDGILTAYEAMNLPLDKSSLVVLSACETGLGDIKSGEGVYGLQRSFLVAGADAMIMSLWKVNDEATQLLMTQFYKNYLSTYNLRDSFRKAQLTLKSSMKEPYFWGAFVLVVGE